MKSSFRVVLHALLPLGFFVYLHSQILRMPYLNYDTDEGIDLMKALLVEKGYRLYTNIWCDQPPLFTLLASLHFKVFGASVVTGRTLVLGLSTVLLAALYRTVYGLHGTVAAVATLLGVIGSAKFIPLSCTVMIGLPALALGMVSIWMMVEARDAKSRAVRRLWVAASSLAMAASLQTKLFSVVMAPAVFALLAATEGNRGRNVRKAMVSFVAWLVGVAAFTGVISILTHEDWNQVLVLHLRLLAPESSDLGTSFWTAWLKMCRQDWVLIVLSVAGLLWNVRHRQWAIWIPVAWWGASFMALVFQRPFFSHYLPLLAIPLAWSAGIGVNVLWQAMARSFDRQASFRKLAMGGILGVSLCWTAVGAGARIGDSLRQLDPRHRYDPDAQQSLLLQLAGYRNYTRWVYSDVPIYPFAVGELAPPELAMISMGRRQSGFLADDYLLEQLEHYKPELLLIGRINYGATVTAYIRRQYTLAHEAHNVYSQPLQLYAAKRLSPNRRRD